MKQVCIVGGAALDITGLPDGVCRLRDSNLGTVRIQVGGVGRNIGCRLTRYALHTELITALGNDFHAQMIEKDCLEHGIGLSHSIRLDEPSAIFLCVLDEERDLLAGVSDMGIMLRITPELLAERLPLLNASSAVVLDANLHPDALTYLCEHVTAPLFYEPVSFAKSRRIGNNIGRCFAIKPNRYEAAHLSGCSCDTVRGVYRAAEWFLREGVQRVFISLGAEGVVWADPDGCGHIEAEPITVVDTTGAGDAMCAAIIHGLLSGLSTEECALAGNRASAQRCARPPHCRPCNSFADKPERTDQRQLLLLAVAGVHNTDDRHGKEKEPAEPEQKIDDQTEPEQNQLEQPCYDARGHAISRLEQKQVQAPHGMELREGRLLRHKVRHKCQRSKIRQQRHELVVLRILIDARHAMHGRALRSCGLRTLERTA